MCSYLLFFVCCYFCFVFLIISLFLFCSFLLLIMCVRLCLRIFIFVICCFLFVFCLDFCSFFCIVLLLLDTCHSHFHHYRHCIRSECSLSHSRVADIWHIYVSSCYGQLGAGKSKLLGIFVSCFLLFIYRFNSYLDRLYLSFPIIYMCFLFFSCVFCNF